MSNEKFLELREKYDSFVYRGFSLEKAEDEIRISFDFEVEGLTKFRPETRIKTDNLNIVNDFSSPVGKNLVFSLGMVELISYWKATCSKNVKIECGLLSDEQISFWKKLCFNGLSEFFYRNGIETDIDSFMNISSSGERRETAENIVLTGKNIIPVGGGKDSAVTAELMSDRRLMNMFFTVNDQQARTETVKAAGYKEENIIKTYRTISPELLELNKQGFLNGHTPFSAIVAFLSAYCAYLIGANYIVLSNESSANDTNLIDAEVNHQYSKSFAFESDFVSYLEKYAVKGINYFSILRAFNELQIARQFAAFPKYYREFRSCNRGSKTNVWCGECAKCLFVYSILSPFIEPEILEMIFGKNMLDDMSLKADFDGLTGISPVKPFECVGTAEEVCFALDKTVKKYKNSGKDLPALLDYYDKSGKTAMRNVLKEFNPENNIPAEFADRITEMYKYVSRDN
jgi:hypothetical protein